MQTFYILIVVAFLLLLAHLLFIEKFNKQEKKRKKIILRDLLGSPLHMLFVIGDSCFFIGLFYYLKDMTKEQSFALMMIGFSILIVGAILYRWLHLWFEKDLSEDDKNKRERSF